ncbi:MAG: transcription antitermination factor NusB [Deltaproteobacteria bacterium]
MGVRRRAREQALMMLYAMDMAGVWPDAAIERFYDAFASGEPLDPPPSYVDAPRTADRYKVDPDDSEARAYAEQIVRGVNNNLEQIDQLISRISLHWRIDRMASVDRNLLRLAAYELTYEQDGVPRKVAINEAVELAKTFGTKESSAFVNGIVDRIGR